MKYAFFFYGQFRSFKYNLENNLQEIYEPIIKNNTIDVFIVTNKEGNYSKENEKEIVNIFNKYNCCVKFIKFWEDLTEYHEKEIQNKRNYFANCRHQFGRIDFTTSLWFRRYVTNKIKNEYCKQHNLEYDLHMFIRLFDMKIKKHQTDIFIKNKIEECCISNKMLASICTIFIGNKEIVDKVFEFGKDFNLYHDDVWNNKIFSEQYKSWDWGLYCQFYKPTYCSEIQIFSHIFFNNIFYENIRFDFNNPNCKENNETLLHVNFCEKRLNP